MEEGQTQRTDMRCAACGARPVVSARVTASPHNPVRFCYVCGTSLRPTTSGEEEWSPAPVECPYTVQDVPKIVWDQLRLWRPHTLLRCLPCSTPHSGGPSPHVSAAVVGVHTDRDTTSTASVHNTGEPPLFYAWPLVSCGTAVDEGKVVELLSADTSSRSLFVQLQVINKMLGEVILEYNAVLSSLQLRCMDEAKMWRTHVSALRNELHQRNEERVVLNKRISHLEHERGQRNENHQRELPEVRRKHEEEHQWFLNTEQQQQEKLVKAFCFLRDTLMDEKK